jgi:glyceraldehyde 3-phosphate dehydrogenase
MYHEDDISKLNWAKHEVDIVIESTGVFVDRASSEKHLQAGAKYVLITAPAKAEDITLIYNINHELFDPALHRMISSASCTTTCLAPVVQVLHKHFGIKHGTVITTHAYTNDQHLVDYPHKKDSFRRSRAAGISIIPTSTGAAKAIGKVIPELNGKLDGNALRVPVPAPSVLSFVAELEKNTDRDKVNEIFHAEHTNYQKSLDVCDIGLVSVDYIRSPYGATVDTLSTVVTDDTQVFVQAWYDNEWGYVTQMVNLLEYMGEKI